MNEAECKIVNHALSINPTHRKLLRCLLTESYEAADWYVGCIKENGDELPAWIDAYANAVDVITGERSKWAQRCGAETALALFGSE